MGVPATIVHGVLFVIGRGLAIIVSRVYQQPPNNIIQTFAVTRELLVPPPWPEEI